MVLDAARVIARGCRCNPACLATFAREQRLALLQSLLDEELNTHGGKSSAVGTWLRTRMEEEKARG